ncbi:hypothetical protein LCGC14_2346210 [marine sediment metagenome]|uniref:Uncharacterized protein n=1 Tax=marine sediment metagenome TaxID=412755 RepID=A0A0F9CY38_9ZZZZ
MKTLNLDLSYINYIELSFLRRLVGDYQLKTAKMIHKQTGVDMKELLKVKKYTDTGEYIEPTGELDCCNSILDRIANIEKSLQEGVNK